MLQKKTGLPQEEELVLCTVTNIQVHSVFVTLDEYGAKTGLIHISEIAPGRIRNIRDFVKEGKKVVCKVLQVNKEKGHIDLSLRRVNETQKRQKLSDVKEEQLAEKIIENFANQRGESVLELYSKLSEKLLSEYPNLFSVFIAVSQDKIQLDKFLDKRIAKDLTDAIKSRIKPPEVKLAGDLVLSSYAPNGVLLIKDALKQSEIVKGSHELKYKGAGIYHLKVTAQDYKAAEKIMKEVVDKITDFAQKHKIMLKFERAQE